jgi:hypothetical protein
MNHESPHSSGTSSKAPDQLYSVTFKQNGETNEYLCAAADAEVIDEFLTEISDFTRCSTTNEICALQANRYKFTAPWPDGPPCMITLADLEELFDDEVAELKSYKARKAAREAAETARFNALTPEQQAAEVARKQAEEARWQREDLLRTLRGRVGGFEIALAQCKRPAAVEAATRTLIKAKRLLAEAEADHHTATPGNSQ